MYARNTLVLANRHWEPRDESGVMSERVSNTIGERASDSRGLELGGKRELWCVA
jgi:hypothetical protein